MRRKKLLTFFIFTEEFIRLFKGKYVDIKSVVIIGKAVGDKRKSMIEEDIIFFFEFGTSLKFICWS